MVGIFPKFIQTMTQQRIQKCCTEVLDWKQAPSAICVIPVVFLLVVAAVTKHPHLGVGVRGVGQALLRPDGSGI